MYILINKLRNIYVHTYNIVSHRLPHHHAHRLYNRWWRTLVERLIEILLRLCAQDWKLVSALSPAAAVRAAVVLPSCSLNKQQQRIQVEPSTL